MTQPKKMPDMCDTFVFGDKDGKVHYVIMLTSVDYQKEEGTFKIFPSEKAALDWRNGWHKE